mgnify:FL=1
MYYYTDLESRNSTGHDEHHYRTRDRDLDDFRGIGITERIVFDDAACSYLRRRCRPGVRWLNEQGAHASAGHVWRQGIFGAKT